MMMMPQQFYTASHMLSEIEGARKGPKMQIAVNGTKRQNVTLETRRGMFQRSFLVRSGHVALEMGMAGSSVMDVATWFNLDSYDNTQHLDWEFCKTRVSNERGALQQLEKLKQATQMCRDALKIDPTNRQRGAMIDRALQISPKHCAMAHYLKFELMSAHHGLNADDKKSMAKAVAFLEAAVAAGKRTADLLQAYDFCPGKFFSWMPTRWLVRSSYMLGSLLLNAERYDAADQALKECLAWDVGDKLGARHKQLLTVLERDGLNGTEVEFLLEARFGEDQLKDTVYALFNYTRALRAFCVKGDCRKSRTLLEYAIENNSFVPSILLAWSNSQHGSDGIMLLGSEMEASDYCADNTHFWCDTEGALDWLERVYCQTKRSKNGFEPLTDNSEIRKLLVEANLIVENTSLPLHSQARKRLKEEGLQKLERIEEIMSSNGSSNTDNNRLKRIVHQRKGYCYTELFQFDQALPQFNSALCLCTDPVKDKDVIKELFYNRADCKQQAGDLRGALNDYTFVYQRIGAFSTAVENIRKLEAQLGGGASVLPPRPPPFPDAGVDGDAEAMQQAMSHLTNSMPPVNLMAHQQSTERCDHCQRGGIALAACSACKTVKFCSKQCQVASWKAIHKYVCSGSKSRIVMGTKMTIQGLEKAPELNGKQAAVTEFLPDKKRFVVEIESNEGSERRQLSVRPQNLSKE